MAEWSDRLVRVDTLGHGAYGQEVESLLALFPDICVFVLCLFNVKPPSAVRNTTLDGEDVIISDNSLI